MFKPSDSTFGTLSTKIFFLFVALIKKIFLQTLVEIFFRYHKNFFRYLGPPYNKKEEKWEFHIWSVGYKKKKKRAIGVNFWRNFWKIFKNEDFGFTFFLKRSNFDAFVRPRTLKTEIFSKKKSRVGYVCIEESFDTLFNMGYGSGKSTMPESVKK